MSHNYAIKRDLRENTGFKFYTGRVGPLFWLLEVSQLSLANPFFFTIVGKPVADVWVDGYTLFLEFGDSFAATGKLAGMNIPNYELSLVIRSSWRIEQQKSILGGSGNDPKDWPKLLKTIIGAKVSDIQLLGGLPEINVVLSNGMRFSSFMTFRGQPDWALIARKPNLGCLCVRGGSLFVEPPDL